MKKRKYNKKRSELADLIGNNPYNYYSFDDEFKKDKKLIALAVKLWGNVAFAMMDAEIKNDKGFVMSLIKDNPQIYKNISPILRSDLQIIDKVVETGWLVDLKCIPEEILMDRGFIRKLLMNCDDCTILSQIGSMFKVDIELATFAIMKSPLSFVLLPKFIRKNREVARLALSKSGNLLEYCHSTLRNDCELVKLAIVSCPAAVKHMSIRLKRNKMFVLELIRINPIVYESLMTIMMNDRDVVLEAVTIGGQFIYEIPSIFNDDKEIMRRWITSLDVAIRQLGPTLRNDINFIYEMCKINREAIFALWDFPLVNDVGFALEMVNYDPESYKYFDKEIRTNKDVVREVAKYRPDLITPSVFEDEIFTNELMNTTPYIRILL